MAILGRTGGEEFVILLAGTPLEASRLLAESIRVRTSRHAVAGIPAFTCSAGVTALNKGESLSDMMRRADAACYEAKMSGCNRINTVV